MSNMENCNFPAFDAAKKVLEEQGHEVISPADLDRLKYPHHNFAIGTPPGFSYEKTLLEDLMFLAECDGIYMLSGWKESKGATVEHSLASALNKVIRYQAQTCYKCLGEGSDTYFYEADYKWLCKMCYLDQKAA